MCFVLICLAYSCIFSYRNKRQEYQRSHATTNGARLCFCFEEKCQQPRKLHNDIEHVKITMCLSSVSSNRMNTHQFAIHFKYAHYNSLNPTAFPCLVLVLILILVPVLILVRKLISVPVPVPAPVLAPVPVPALDPGILNPNRVVWIFPHSRYTLFQGASLDFLLMRLQGLGLGLVMICRAVVDRHGQ